MRFGKIDARVGALHFSSEKKPGQEETFTRASFHCNGDTEIGTFCFKEQEGGTPRRTLDFTDAYSGARLSVFLRAEDAVKVIQALQPQPEEAA